MSFEASARRSSLAALALLAAASPSTVRAAEEAGAAAAAVAPETAVRMIQLPKGLKATVWASEPLFENPVSFAFDEQGRALVSETHRISNAVLDIRARGKWASHYLKQTGHPSPTPDQVAKMADQILDAELACRTTADREAFIKKYFVGDLDRFTATSERVRLVVDKDGDGKADTATTFAEGFSTPLDGVASGVLSWRGQVFFTNIPNVWSLRDGNGDGVADERKALSSGYGVRFGFMGHDMHGLRMGPDGKLYWSIGDRGAHVQTADGRTVDSQHTGAVFRSNLDGSDLEIFAFGLRNPQELVFDEHGDLFTGDNNSDGGDKARFVHLVEGGDSGWRIGYQFMESPARRGPWNAEKMWDPPWADQPASIVPPIANITSGPSGLAHHPGTGVATKYKHAFFLADFRGQANTSGVHAFWLEPQGAGHKLVRPEHFAWGVLATDVDFGPDGGLYVSDWVYGWNETSKGRLYRIGEPAFEKSAAGKKELEATRALLGSGLASRHTNELVALLAHPDQRVRQEAELRLVDSAASDALVAVAKGSDKAAKTPLARLHAIWGLGVLLRPHGVALLGRPDTRPSPVGAPPAGSVEALVALLKDADGEVRAQAAKVLGDAHRPEAHDMLVKLLEDPAPRARFFAAQALGKTGGAADVPALAALLRRTGGSDPLIRHAASYALASIGDVPALLSTASDADASARMGALLALRRLGRPEVSRLLRDGDVAVVREAARAINDAPIEAATPELAVAADHPVAAAAAKDPVVLGRAINASFRLGRREDAARLARFASDDALPASSRRDAVLALAAWPEPSGRDRVTGVWRPLPSGKRDTKPALDALAAVLPSLLLRAPDEVSAAAAQAAVKLKATSTTPALAKLVGRADAGANVRLEALRALDALGAPEERAALELAGKDADQRIRLEALRLGVKLDPAHVIDRLRTVLHNGTTAEKQVAARLLGETPGGAADGLLGDLLDEILAAKAPPELTLDVLEAADRRPSPALKQKLAAFEAKRPQDDLGPYREALVGGNVDRGRVVFFNRGDVQCQRCHAIEGFGGDVGPELQGIGTRRTREYLLEAIVYPSKRFAPGFESAIVTMKTGAIHGGTVKDNSAARLALMSPDEGLLKLAKRDIKTQEPGASGMPDGFGQILSKRDLRDLIEFLASLKDDGKAKAAPERGHGF